MSSLLLDNISKKFGDVAAVRDLSLAIEDGEFVVLLGPSGCGKSTLLRMIAGLEPISSGSITMDDADITSLEPRDRDIAFVFQSYALYPHMTVRRNLSFPLIMREFRWWHQIPIASAIRKRVLVKRPYIREKVDQAAAVLDLTGLLGRYPATLSGGQRQRVALGRAMVRDPKVFLMDEPLSNLDAKLRGQMRTELLALHQTVGGTTIYVTHDQGEAMSMGDKVGVMKDGVMVQYGTPRHVYEHPANTYVAQFIGNPPMNLVPVARTSGGHWNIGNQHVVPPQHLVRSHDGGQILLGLHAEDISLRSGPEPGALSGRVLLTEDAGADLLVQVELPGMVDQATPSLDPSTPGRIEIRVPSRSQLLPGDEIFLAPDYSRCCLFNAATGESLSPTLDEATDSHSTEEVENETNLQETR